MDYTKLWKSISLLAGVLTFGTLGYHFVEDMPFFEALYMTIITISTVGFSEIKPLSPLGRIITIGIISTGVTIGAYTIGMVLRMFVEGELKKSYGRRKLEKQISKIEGHYIICGYGRIGRLICDELHAHNVKFVVIEKDTAAIEILEEKEFFHLPLDATSEDSLLKAGIERARGLVTAVQSDADNIFIILTAKGIRPDIFILSRSSDLKNEQKLIKAGATRVVSPYLIGGNRMAQVLIKPTVIDFIDIAMMNSKLGLVMEEARIRPCSECVGKNLIESQLRQNYGVIIVSIKKQSGEMIFNPSPNEILEQDDTIVVLGKKEDMKRLNADL